MRYLGFQEKGGQTHPEGDYFSHSLPFLHSIVAGLLDNVPFIPGARPALDAVSLVLNTFPMKGPVREIVGNS